MVAKLVLHMLALVLERFQHHRGASVANAAAGHMAVFYRGNGALRIARVKIVHHHFTVSAELGRTRLLINELLQLGQGSVVELNKLAGEPLEVYVNGKMVARGEAVVINEKFGIRLTDIISPIERVKQLG